MSTKRDPHYTCRKHESCDLDTDQPALFEEHVRAKGHGCNRLTVKPMPKRLWVGPRLTIEGRPFEPTGLDVGATVTWRELVPTGDTREALRYDSTLGRDRWQVVPEVEWVDRTGQVWCKAYGGAWIIPDDEIPAEHEAAVLVVPSKLMPGRFEHSQTFYATAAGAAA